MAASPKRELRVFLAKVVAVTAAALVVLYAASAWLGLGGRREDAGIVSWEHAARHYGEHITVEGKVVETRRTEKACFLNFHPDWRSTFTAVIFARRFDAFPPNPEDVYRGKTVRVTGLIREYEGKPEIILESPSQIEVMD